MPCAHTHRHRGTRGTEPATLQVAGPAASHTPPPGPTEAVRQAAASLLLLRHTWLNRDNGGCSLQPRTSPRDQAPLGGSQRAGPGDFPGGGPQSPGVGAGLGQGRGPGPREECSCEGRAGRGARQSLPRPARSLLVSSLTPPRPPLHGSGILPTKWSEPGEAPRISGRQRPPFPGLPGPSPWALPAAAAPCLCSKTEPLRVPACRLPLSGQGLSHLLIPASQKAGWELPRGPCSTLSHGLPQRVT